MKRSGYIERKAPMRRKRARRIDRMTDDDRAYLAFVHRDRCAGSRFLVGHVCEGPIEQAHERDMTGLGLKAPVRRSVALCRSLHQQYDQHRGRFLTWDRETRKKWLAGAIEESNERFDRERAL